MTLELRDISKWNQWLDPAATRAAGIVGIVAKATEGNGYIDPAWYGNRAAMLAQGFVPGAYHFSRPDLGNPPDAEADFFLNVVNPSNGWLLAHDAESSGGSLAWCEEFELHCASLLGGYHVWFYSYWSWMTSRGIVGSPLLTRSPLWFAWPDANGTPPTPMAMQQYGAGPVAGFAGAVDLNRFFGEARQLAALTVGGGSMATIDDVFGLLQAVNSTTLGRMEGEIKDTRALLDDVNAVTLGRIEALVKAHIAAQGIEQVAIDAIAANGAAAAQIVLLLAAQATTKDQLDQVLAAQAGGTPADLSALEAHLGTLGASMAAVDQHLILTAKHLGVDAATGQAS